MKTWRSRLMLVAAGFVVVLLVACGGETSPEGSDFGFLPIPTQTPVPTITPLPQEAREELCPDLPRNVTFSVGDETNLYETLSLHSAVALLVIHDQRQDWVLRADVEHVLKMLDSEVTLEAWDIDQRKLFAVSAIMVEPGHDQCGPPVNPLQFLVDVDADRIGLADGGKVQAPIPVAFVRTVLDFLSDVTATPSPRPTRDPYTPGPTSTPVIVPDGAPFFGHPEEELVWDGPDDRVRSRDRAHCEHPDLHEAYGIPGLIAVNEEGGYWPIGAGPLADGLRWTGYHHDGWEIWQGEDPKTVYLLHDDLDDIAFEYENFGCI